MILSLLLLSSLFSSVLAICGPHPASDADYVPLAVGSNGGPLTTVLNDARDEGVIGMAMNGPKDECDAACLFTLDNYDAPQHHSTLVVRKELAEFVPLGYTLLPDEPVVFCARSEGTCGARVPVWRHFSLNGTGIYHTYSLDDSMVDGYTREALPLCFVWDQEAVEFEGSGQEEDRRKRDSELVKDGKTCDVSFPSRTKMEMISEYENNRTGSEHDHFYTLKTSKDLAGYNKTKDLGLIMTKNDSSSCSCLVELVQTLDNQTGIFHRIDHKLMRSDAELNRIFEKYNATGEKFYCAAQKGQCGASLPLYKHFDYVYIDSIITTSDKDVPPHSYRYPTEPLCWIWSASYDPVDDGTTRQTSTSPRVTTPSPNSTVRSTPRVSPSSASTSGRVKRSTEWEEEETDWTDDGWNATTWNTTTKATPRPTNATTRITTTTGTTRLTSTSHNHHNTTTVRMTTQSSNSTVRSTAPPSSLALDEIIVRMVRSAMGNDTNWREAVRSKLRELSDKL